jgi:hypothetical protein
VSGAELAIEEGTQASPSLSLIPFMSIRAGTRLPFIPRHSKGRSRGDYLFKLSTAYATRHNSFGVPLSAPLGVQKPIEPESRFVKI